MRSKSAETTKEKNQIEEAFSDDLTLSEEAIRLDELPNSWKICRIGMIGTVVNGSTPSRKHGDYWQGDIPWASSGEVRNNIITDTREKITKAGFDSCSVRLLSPGTVLLAMIGEGKTRGQSAILRIRATINQNIAAILLSHGMVSPEFLWRWFQFQYEATRERGSGSGPQALNCQRVRELPFVLAPITEQQEIVRRVDALFALADRIEEQYEKAKMQVDALTQSILAKAFRGELVPTEAELAAREGRAYESAAQLLERIRAGKTGNETGGGKRAVRKRRAV
jgi:type I restriction enzyme S subunit